MTEITFYTGAADKLLVVCRLCAKALNHGQRTMIFSPYSSLLEKLDKLLWTFQSTSFLSHCFIDDGEKLVIATPIVLSNRAADQNGYDILINLHDQCPPAFEQFNRVIEISTLSPEDKLLARKRYRLYQQSGYELHHHNL